MPQKRLEALSRPGTRSARTSSIPCIMPEFRRNRGASFLGLQAVSLPDMLLTGSCSAEHGILANEYRSKLGSLLH